MSAGPVDPPVGVLLDLDGTLLDSNDAHARAWVDALAEHGVHVEFARVRALIGMGGDKILPAVAGLGEDTPAGQAIAARRAELFARDHLPGPAPTPGAAALVAALRARGLKLVVATSARRDEVRGLLAKVDATDLLEDATSSDDADRSKPDPDIVGAALRRAGLAPHQAVMIGDTPYDVEAARRAGVRTIALRCGGWDAAALAGAVAVYADPADLLRHLDASVLGPGRPSS